MSDTGAGMSAEVRERAFDPFFTTKGPGGGSGLGLAMVYGFAEQSGGHVRFERTSEPGTTVALYLPAAQAPVVEPSSSGEAAARGRGEHVLLVEDEFDVRDVVARALERMGYRVRAVGDADTGLSHLEDGVDVLVSDVGLPGRRSGVDLAREARALRPDLPVLLISGHAAAAIAGRASLPEGVTVLQKPVHLGELARSVRAALDEPTPRGDERSSLTP
jgi:CheY-like chemotaxis protein